VVPIYVELRGNNLQYLWSIALFNFGDMKQGVLKVVFFFLLWHHFLLKYVAKLLIFV